MNFNGFDAAVAGGFEHVFHFHGFEDDDGVTFLDVLTWLDHDVEHKAGHGCFDGVDFLVAAGVQAELFDESVVVVGDGYFIAVSADAEGEGTVVVVEFDVVDAVSFAVEQDVVVAVAIGVQVEVLHIGRLQIKLESSVDVEVERFGFGHDGNGYQQKTLQVRTVMSSG